MSSKKTKTEQAPAPQGDMFVQHHRDVKLQQYTDSLERMGELVDFEQVAAAVDAACPRADRSKGGRPPYPTLVMVKVLFLQELYNLSDEQAEHQLLDRRSFQRFCGLVDELRIPDARTVWLWERLKLGARALRSLWSKRKDPFPVARVPAHEVEHVDPIEHRAAELQQRVGALPAPAHVALVLHALVHDILDRRLRTPA